MLINYYPPNIETISVNEYYEFKNSSTPNKDISSKIRIINQLNDFALLEENWDSYGALRISENVIEKAISVVKNLYLKNIFIYYTAPSPSGDILLELKNKNKTIEIEISPESDITYTTLKNGDEIKTGIWIQDNEELINWFIE
jgi:hypothetical protein